MEASVLRVVESDYLNFTGCDFLQGRCRNLSRVWAGSRQIDRAGTGWSVPREPVSLRLS